MAKSFDELAKRTMTPAMIRKGKLRARAYNKEMDRKQIIATMKAIRKASGMGQKELALALGIKPTYGGANGNAGGYQVVDTDCVCPGSGWKIGIDVSNA